MTHRAAATNRLLARLPAADRRRFVAAGDRVELGAGEVLMGPGRRATHAYFPLGAIVSLGIVTGEARECLEVALVGPEGMVGVPLLLGATQCALRATVIRPGAGLRIDAAALQQQLLASGVVDACMRHYVLVSLTQMAQAALCTRYHGVEQRLARWLLMSHDREPLGLVHATHAFLAFTLGVRRAGVTRAAADLQKRQLIAYHRGVLSLVDRPGLEAVACGCYAADRACYDALMGRIPRP